MAQKVTHEDTSGDAWQTPTFENGWTNYDTTWAPVSFMKDAAGVVHIKGLIRSGTLGARMFTLPVGYRPSIQLLFAGMSNDAICRLEVLPDGTVKNGTGGNNSWISLNNLHFKAEQ